MKTKSLLCPLLAAAATLFPLSPAGATVPAPLVLNFTYYAQVSDTLDGNIERGEVQAFRLNSKDVLTLLSLQTGMVFPKGARIIIEPDGDSFVTDKKGNFIVDVSAFVIADFGESLFDGFYDIDTEHEKSNIFIDFALTLNVPSQALTLEMLGMAKEKFRGSKPNKQGTQKFKGNVIVDVNGRGSLDEELILGEGTVKLNGKEVEED